MQADVEISFEITTFEGVEKMDPSWANPQAICGQKGGPAKGGVGPFGLLVLASKDIQEYTAVYFKVFRNETKYVVLMCSDQSRHISLNRTILLQFPLLQHKPTSSLQVFLAPTL